MEATHEEWTARHDTTASGRCPHCRTPAANHHCPQCRVRWKTLCWHGTPTRFKLVHHIHYPDSPPGSVEVFFTKRTHA